MRERETDSLLYRAQIPHDVSLLRAHMGKDSWLGS